MGKGIILHFIIRFLLKIFFRVQVIDIEHYTNAGDRVLLVSNCGSLLDPLLLSCFLNNRITVAIDSKIYKKWWIRPFLLCSKILEADFNSPISTLKLVNALEKHEHCMVFHEKSFMQDSHFMKILEATAMIAERTEAKIVPVRISGAAYSKFSYFRHKQLLRYFPKITLTVLPAQSIDKDLTVSGKKRRKLNAIRLYDIMSNLLLESTNTDMNFAQAFVEAMKVHGKKYIIAEDQERKCVDYKTILLKANVLGRALARLTKNELRLGFMLPSSLAGIVSFLGFHLTQKIPVMINFTAGAYSVVGSCQTLDLKTVVSSRTFIRLGELEFLEKAILDAGMRILYLEDIAKRIAFTDKIKGLLATMFCHVVKTPASEPFAILFTSGTEGLPKSVFISHKNVLVNKEQALGVLSVHSGDRLFNCLPLFHVFGLGVGTVLPLTSGIKVFFYPSPLHFRIVPKLYYESQSTVICGTDTFLAGYARYGRPYDFCNTRLVIEGAEKLRESTAKTWKEKFGVEIMEGYGATETSPVLSVNTDANKAKNSVGRLLPGLEYKLKKVEGITEGGSLCVKGDNVMLGYMRASNKGVLEKPRAEIDGQILEGWYDTGDIVEVDQYGFIYIKGRAKRFAKLGGEMVSLVAIEMALSELWPDVPLGIVAVPDSKKGEQLVLIIEKQDVTTNEIATYFATKGVSALWTPKKILCVKQAPLLGSGKFDYNKAKVMADEMTAS